MATTVHTPTQIVGDGVKISSGSGDLTQGASADAIASGSGNGSTFSRSTVSYFIVTNTSAGAINLTVKATTPSSISDAGTTINDNTVSLDAYSAYMFKTFKNLADGSGTVTIEAASTGLYVEAFY